MGVKSWEIIADNLSAAGWSWGCVSTINSTNALLRKRVTPALEKL